MEPARLICPWNSPGKNIRVGCHFLLHPKDWCDGNMICWCATVHLFPVLWSPVSCWELETSHGRSMCVFNHFSPPGSSVHGIFLARILEWFAVSFSRGFSWPQGSNLGLLHCRQRFFTNWATRKVLFMTVALYYSLKSGSLIPPAPFFFLKTALAIWDLLCFYTNFRRIVLYLWKIPR